MTKKVKIKGSEVGYSLQKIVQCLEFQHRLKTDREFFKQVNERSLFKSSTEVERDISVHEEKISLIRQIKQDVSETFNAVLKPEQMQEKIEPKLLAKKKKKNRLRL